MGEWVDFGHKKHCFWCLITINLSKMYVFGIVFWKEASLTYFCHKETYVCVGPECKSRCGCVGRVEMKCNRYVCCWASLHILSKANSIFKRMQNCGSCGVEFERSPCVLVSFRWQLWFSPSLSGKTCMVNEMEVLNWWPLNLFGRMFGWIGDLCGILF